MKPLTSSYLPMHITGEIRTLSEQTTHNGPLVTQILNDILTKDTTFNQYASNVIDEVAGIHFYNQNDNPSIQTDRSEQLVLYLEIIFIALS